MFSAAEVDIAGDLVTERLTKGIRSGYHFMLAERGVRAGRLMPVTDRSRGRKARSISIGSPSSPEEQRKGLGAQVYARAEAAMRKAGRQAYLCRHLIV